MTRNLPRLAWRVPDGECAELPHSATALGTVTRCAAQSALNFITILARR
jgi:hypothetical protein